MHLYLASKHTLKKRTYVPCSQTRDGHKLTKGYFQVEQGYAADDDEQEVRDQEGAYKAIR